MWTLDAFDFTAFLLTMAPIAKDLGVPLTEVAAVVNRYPVEAVGQRRRQSLARRTGSAARRR